jgi:hypothetical protein
VDHRQTYVNIYRYTCIHTYVYILVHIQYTPYMSMNMYIYSYSEDHKASSSSGSASDSCQERSRLRALVRLRSFKLYPVVFFSPFRQILGYCLHCYTTAPFHFLSRSLLQELKATIDKVFYYVSFVLTTCFGPYIRPLQYFVNCCEKEGIIIYSLFMGVPVSRIERQASYELI